MGTYKRKIKSLFILMFFLTMFDLCFGQDLANQIQIRQSISTGDSAINARFEEDLTYFRKSGESFILISNPEYYRKLRPYSKEIRDRVFPCYKKCSTSHYNRKVLGLLDLPQYMKDSLLNYKYTELEVRAGLGDTVAQREVYEKFKAFIQRDNKTSDEVYQYLFKEKLPVTLLVYIGSEESIKIYLEGMNSTDVYEDIDMPGIRNKVSVFGALLGNYSAYYGGDVIVNGFYYDRFLYSEAGSLGEEYQLWLRKLEEYFYEKHGVKLNIRAPYLIQGYEYIMEH